MNNVKSFTFFANYYKALINLEEKDQKELLLAMVKYVFEDIEPEFKEKDYKNLAWQLMIANLNTSKNKSNANAGAPIGNKNASKNNGEEKTITKQSQNNQNSIKSQSVTFYSYSNNIIIKDEEKNGEEIKRLFNEYIDLRYNKKYTVTDTVLKRLVNKLNEYGTKDKDKIEMLEQAINGGWKDLYAPEKKEVTLYEEI